MDSIHSSLPRDFDFIILPYQDREVHENLSKFSTDFTLNKFSLLTFDKNVFETSKLHKLSCVWITGGWKACKSFLKFPFLNSTTKYWEPKNFQGENENDQKLLDKNKPAKVSSEQSKKRCTNDNFSLLSPSLPRQSHVGRRRYCSKNPFLNSE